MRAPTDILLLVLHPWGEVRCTLDEWMRHGPGPRYLLAPVGAWDARSGETLPLEAVPRPYRNDVESIRMILDGKATDPWNRDKALLGEAIGWRR